MVVVENSLFLGEKTVYFLFQDRWIAFVLSTKMDTNGNALIPEEHMKVLNIVSILMTLFIQDVPVLSYLS